MTGRSNDRTGVFNHGFPLRLQEPTVAQALRDAGYATAHFGKWHLNGLKGPGVPILASDTHTPGTFGFETWLSVTNFFDRDPIMGLAGEFVELEGDSSEIIVAEALEFVRAQHESGTPFFAVIWYGTPHAPFVASAADKAAFLGLDEVSQNHHGELVAMDRSLGALRAGLRSLGIAEETLLWFTSDNGGLPRIEPDTTGGLRGFKGDIYEGGLRVPAIIEWPAGIVEPYVTSYPAATMDIFPTLVEVVGLSDSVLLKPTDGISLAPLFRERLMRREKPIPFRHLERGAIVDNKYKIVTLEVGSGSYELYDLERDPGETTDLFARESEAAGRLKALFEAWNSQVEASIMGADYPEGTVDPNQPERRFWWEDEAYDPYLEEWKRRPEYAERLKQAHR
jgi:arylsulfatase A-like enzyme